MRNITRRLSLLAAAALSTTTCAFPTDVGGNAYVSIFSPSTVLLRGGELELQAHVWLRTAPDDSVELKNVALRWSSADVHLATVGTDGSGVGRVTGVNAGQVEIRAVAGGYEKAAPGVYALRVANPLEIDSIAPDTVRYGQRLTLYGVGVRDLFFAGLGPGTLTADSLSVAGDPKGLGQVSFWVPFPSRTGSVFAAGSGQLVSAPKETVVLPYDIYEPNEAAPAVIDLDGPRPIPAVPTLRLLNPALAFEDLRNGTPFGADWYRFRTTATSTPFTFVFVAPALGGAHIATFGGADSSWAFGSGNNKCKGYDFKVEMAPSDSLILALKRLPADTVDFIAAYVQQGRYFLAVGEGYATADPRIPADRYEEDDLCQFADDNFADPTRQIDVGTPFAENLTIDNAHDVDWIRFRVSGVIAKTVSIRATSRPFGAVDRSDIDLYLLTVPAGTTTALNLLASDVSHGSASGITQLLNPGDYYLVVADSAGIPTRYSLCIEAAATCTPPPPPPTSSIAAAPAAVPSAQMARLFAGAAYAEPAPRPRRR
jgi:Big-like domain-containing protein